MVNAPPAGSSALAREGREVAVYRDMIKLVEMDFFQLLSRLNAVSQPVDGRLHPFAAMRDAERLEPHLDDPQSAQYHGSVHVSHMGDAERLAGHFPEPGPEHDAAFCV